MKLMMNHRICGALVLVSAALLANGAVAQTPQTPVAQLGSVSITSAEVEQLLRSMPASERAQVKSNPAALENWLRQRLVSEALLKETQKQRWAERPEVKANIDAAVKEVTARIVTSNYLDSVSQLPSGFPSQAEVAAAYERAKPQLQVPATYRIAQIFLPLPQQSDTAVVEALRAEAAGLSLQASKGDFAALAKARSKDEQSAANGGEVGNLPLEQMLPEVRAVVAKMQPNQVSEPVQTAGGFHILKLLSSQPARTASLDEVKPQLQASLRDQKRQELVYEHLQKIAPSQNIKIDNATLNAVVQNAR